MNKYYEVKGMSCEGCVNNVKQALIELPDVTDAEVKLNPPGALLTMTKSIDTQVLQSQLDKAGNYTISNSYGDGNHVDDNTPEVQRTRSLSDIHPERDSKPFGIDHEPGV